MMEMEKYRIDFKKIIRDTTKEDEILKRLQEYAAKFRDDILIAFLADYGVPLKKNIVLEEQKIPDGTLFKIKTEYTIIQKDVSWDF